MSMSRIDHSLGRGSGSSYRAARKPINVTGTVTSQMITPVARTHGVDPNARAMRPAMATASPTYPTRSDQTAILQSPLSFSSGRSSMPGIVRRRSANGRLWSGAAAIACGTILAAGLVVGLTACGGGQQATLSAVQVQRALAHDGVQTRIIRVPAHGQGSLQGALFDAAGYRKHHIVAGVFEVSGTPQPSGPTNFPLSAYVFDSPSHVEQYPFKKRSVAIRDSHTHRVVGRAFRVANVTLTAPNRQAAQADAAIRDLEQEVGTG